MCLTEVLRTGCEEQKLYAFDFQETLISLCYRLLNYRALGDQRPTDQLDNRCHLTFLAFMSTLLPDYGHRYARYSILAGQLRASLHADSSGDPQGQALTLWCLIMGGITLFDVTDDEWLQPLIKRTAENLGIGDWEAARGVLAQFPWVKAAHDQAGAGLWESAHIRLAPHHIPKHSSPTSNIEVSDWLSNIDGEHMQW
jgi:hypothetical protein